MLLATCHCGAVRLQAPRKPRRLTDCNCSICWRYGTRWAYYKHAEVQVIAEPGAVAAYSWGDKHLRFVRCSHCGTITHWEPLNVQPDSRMGINSRNFEPAAVQGVRVRRLDGAASWKFLD
jgi:hypothetical protein